jgi:hypothetical protein
MSGKRIRRRDGVEIRIMEFAEDIWGRCMEDKTMYVVLEDLSTMSFRDLKGVENIILHGVQIP